VDLISRVFTAGSHRRELMTIARLITGIITRPLGPFFPLASDEAFGRNDRLTSVLLSYLLREKKSMAHSSPDQRQPRQFCHRERSLTEACDQKLASDSSGLPGGFSGQRAWVRILKKWAPGSYCLELVVACPAAGTSALILLVEGS
jgi:hypothetical protein